MFIRWHYCLTFQCYLWERNLLEINNTRILWKLVIMLLLLLLRCLNSKTMICHLVYNKETQMYIFVKLNLFLHGNVIWVMRTESSYWIFSWTWTNRKWIVLSCTWIIGECSWSKERCFFVKVGIFEYIILVSLWNKMALMPKLCLVPWQY